MASWDGSIYAVASWGTEDDANPEVQIFDRNLNLVGGIDTPGSPFSVDMLRDGRYVVVGGKHLHANEFARGSDVFSYDTGIGLACPADFNDEGVVNVRDLRELLDNQGPCPGCPTDLTGDGIVNIRDLLALLRAWGSC